MAQANLSEILFKPSFKHRETSTLIQRAHHAKAASLHTPLEGDTANNWYRMLNQLLWTWRGVDALEIVEVLSRIAASDAEHSDSQLLDTVVGYRNGNWIYEWVHQGMQWQQRAVEQQDPLLGGQYWLNAANFYSIAGYPHLKGDELAEQAEVLSNRAYEEAALLLPYQLKELSFNIEGGSPITGFLHMPDNGKAPFPTVLMCGSLDTLQTDYHRLFSDYLAPRGIAMLTIDMPSIGASSKWKLTQDSSFCINRCSGNCLRWRGSIINALAPLASGLVPMSRCGWRIWSRIGCAALPASARWCTVFCMKRVTSSGCRICIWMCWPAVWGWLRPPIRR